MQKWTCQHTQRGDQGHREFPIGSSREYPGIVAVSIPGREFPGILKLLVCKKMLWKCWQNTTKFASFVYVICIIKAYKLHFSSACTTGTAPDRLTYTIYHTVQWFAHHIVSPHDTDIAILCVCPSHSGNFRYCIETAKHIVTIFQHEVAQSFYQTFLSSNIKHLTGSFFAEANILVGYKKFRNFRPLTRYILQMIQGSSIIVVENQ